MILKTTTGLEFWDLSYEERKNFTGIVKTDSGSISYFKNGFLHREDGPARIFPEGYQGWHLEGKFHNLNGPARIYPNGSEEYWVYGKKTTKEAVNLLKDMLKLRKIKDKI
jgi:hypothetical protein